MRIAQPLSFITKRIAVTIAKRTTLVSFGFIILAGGVIASQNLLTTPDIASAATPPDSCFAFNAGTGTITRYYNNEANNSANPACPRAVDIPATIGGVSVVSIGSYAFPDNQLTSVTIPNSVTSIGDWAFSNNQLTAVTIPSSVTSIGSGAFSSNKLTSVTIPSGVTSIGGAAFYNNQLTTVTIPSSVTSIGSGAFSSNKLTAVTIPSSVTSIGSGAFTGNKLTAVTIPSSVTSIGDRAFSNNQLTAVTIPSSVTSIGSDAFSNNQLTSVTIPSGVTSIGGSAFYNNQLTAVTIPSSVTSIGDSAFSGNKLTAVTIPSSVTSIGSGAFSSNKLTAVTIPSSVTSIDNRAFSNNQLTAVTIPSSVTSIGSNAFSGNQLTAVTIPSSVTSIGDSAFNGNQLTSVTIPSSVASIGFDAFALQSQYGRDLDWCDNGAPCIWSDDPTEVQAAYDSIWYVKLYTADPSNPHNIQDGVMSEERWWGMDANANGTTRDSLGGHIVNPARTTINTVDTNGSVIEAVKQVTGTASSDGSTLTNYSASAGGAFAPLDPGNVTPAEQAAMDAGFAQYHRAGSTQTFTPQAISGYVTPAPQAKTLVAGDNTLDFTYNRPVLSVPFVSNDVADGVLVPSTTPGSVASPLLSESKLSIANDNTCSTIQSAELLAPGSVSAPQGITMLGGLGFTLDCTTAATTTVSLTLGSQANPDTLRVYKDIAGTLTDITSQVTFTTNNGKTVLTYTLTDGGALDEDGIANGTIVDPIFIGTTGEGGELASTGVSLFTVAGAAAVLVATGAALLRRSFARLN